MRLKLAASLAATAIAGTALLAAGSTAWAGTGPGSQTEVTADVLSSLSIQSLPTDLSPSLSTARQDTPQSVLKACNTVGTNLKASKCVFGDTKGTKTMVLWGDSHAFMWFPAVNAVAKAARWRLVVLLEYGCPVASISVWNPLTKTPYKNCDLFRANMITTINKLNPSLVVLSEAFTSQAASAGGAGNTISNAQWQAALTKTLKALHSRSMKKLVIGSTASSSSAAVINPPACLAVNSAQVQKCTIADTTGQQAQRAAEKAAATATSTTYVDVMPWLCAPSTSPVTCAAVIGDTTGGYKVVYYSTGHITQTYSLFLTTVMQAALRPHMK